MLPFLEYNLDEEAAKTKLLQGFGGPETGLLGFFLVRSQDSLLQSLGYGCVNVSHSGSLFCLTAV
jgi:hypothetical protein